MIDVKIFNVTVLMTNCCLLTDRKTGKMAVTDPGAPNEELNSEIEKNGGKLEYVILTHGHYDHISYAKQLASEKGLDEEFALYDRVERIAGEEIMSHRKMLKPVCANVDFYSGFVYTMLNIPEELFTPLFAIARITGWSAHRLEELLNAGKIIRPAYKYVGQHTEFHDRDNRN